MSKQVIGQNIYALKTSAAWQKLPLDLRGQLGDFFDHYLYGGRGGGIGAAAPVKPVTTTTQVAGNGGIRGRTKTRNNARVGTIPRGVGRTTQQDLAH